jgi:hypothetical protein
VNASLGLWRQDDSSSVNEASSIVNDVDVVVPQTKNGVPNCRWESVVDCEIKLKCAGVVWMVSAALASMNVGHFYSLVVVRKNIDKIVIGTATTPMN